MKVHRWKTTITALAAAACLALAIGAAPSQAATSAEKDRKSTRLNSSHGYISYAVFCLKKKKQSKQISAILQLSTALSESTIFLIFVRHLSCLAASPYARSPVQTSSTCGSERHPADCDS